MDLEIDTVAGHDLDWVACWEGQVDTDGYFNDWLEAQNMAAMSAQAAVRDLPAHSPGLEARHSRYPSELVGLRSEFSSGPNGSG